MLPLKRFEMIHNQSIDEKFHQLNIGNIGNVIYWWNFFALARDIVGDIVECGVGRGRSLIVIAAINQFLDPEEGGRRKIFGYDSFCGFPEPTSEDSSNRQPRKGEWSRSPSGKYKYTSSFIQLVLREAGVDDRAIMLTSGYFCDSLPGHPDRPIALLHIDADLYQSYRAALENLYGRVASGGIVVFDDFLHEEARDEKFPGARLAVKEFLGSRYSDLRTSMSGGCYYIKP